MARSWRGLGPASAGEDAGGAGPCGRGSSGASAGSAIGGAGPNPRGRGRDGSRELRRAHRRRRRAHRPTRRPAPAHRPDRVAGPSRSRSADPPPITGPGGPSTPRAGSKPATGSGSVPAPAVRVQPRPWTRPGARPRHRSPHLRWRPAVGTGVRACLTQHTATTGIDWNQMLSDFGPPARTILEVGRLIPGWGLVAGLASDS